MFAKDLNVSQICAASDCQGVVHEIDQTNEARGDYCMVVKVIKSWTEIFQVYIFGHGQREANGDANSLARAVTSLDVGVHVWLVNPPNNILYLHAS